MFEDPGIGLRVGLCPPQPFMGNLRKGVMIPLHLPSCFPILGPCLGLFLHSLLTVCWPSRIPVPCPCGPWWGATQSLTRHRDLGRFWGSRAVRGDTYLEACVGFPGRLTYLRDGWGHWGSRGRMAPRWSGHMLRGLALLHIGHLLTQIFHILLPDNHCQNV